MIDSFKEDLNLILDHTTNCWNDFNNKTIFISGGTGFFGIWMQMSFIFINRKLNLNSKIILLTRSKEKFLNIYPWIEKYDEIVFVEGDITNFSFFDQKIDYIIHAATEASSKLNIEHPLVMFDTIVSGTKRMLEFAKIKNVKSFLFISSGAVYGKQPPEIENISEDYTGAPLTIDAGSVYGEGKRMAEVLCAVYHKQFNLPIKIARCYAFIGPFLPLASHFAAGNFIKDVIENRDIIIDGDGSPYRSYMYSADLMIWLWNIFFTGNNNKPYNVGSPHSVSISDLAEMIRKCGESDETKIIIKKLYLGQPPQRYVPCVDRITEELKLKIYTDLETAIIKTIKFNKKNKLDI